MLLLCIRLKEENINQKIPKNIPENKKKNEFIKGTVMQIIL